MISIVILTDPAINQDLLEGREKSERFFGRRDLRLGDNFHQRGAGPIEIDSRGRFEMETFGHVFLEMNANQAHFLVRDGDVLLCVFRVGQIM